MPFRHLGDFNGFVSIAPRSPGEQPYSVRYDQVNAMLLNEFPKEHKAALEEKRQVEKLEATVALAHGLLFHAVMLTAVNIALVLVRLDHVARRIINANHGTCAGCDA